MRFGIIRIFASLMLVSTTGCSLGFDFDRLETIVAGRVEGTAVRADDDAPASFARLRIDGYGIDKTTNQDGEFVVNDLSSGNWVFSLTSDDDGNGWPERTRTIKARVVTWTPPLAVDVSGNKVSVPFVSGVPEPTGISLGTVELVGSAALKGEFFVEKSDGTKVSPAVAGYVGKVFVIRDACFLDDDTRAAVITDEPCPTDDAEIGERLTLGAEAQSGVDARGFYAFQGIDAGQFFVVAALFKAGTIVSPMGVFLSMSTPVLVEAGPSDVLAPGVGVPTLVIGDPDGTPTTEVSTIEIGLSPSPEITLARLQPQNTVVVFTPVDTPRPPCLLGIKAGPVTGFRGSVAVDAILEPFRDGFVATVEAPVGVFDLRICTSVGEGGVENVVVTPTIGERAPMRVGPSRVRFIPLCGLDTRDCDEDGLVGLPPIDPSSADYESVVDDWRACATECAEIVTPNVTASTCDVGNVTFDCDDDGDLQADVTEHPSCYGPGLGTDLDGDGLCEGQDPFPLCAANDADLCDVDAEPTRTNRLSAIIGEPRCDIGTFSGPTNAGDATCTVVGDPNNEPGCDRFKMECRPRESRIPDCTDADDDTACGEGECYRRKCYLDTCIVDGDCPNGKVCDQGACLNTCDGFFDTSCGFDERCLAICRTGNGCATATVDGGVGGEPELACIPAGIGSEGAACIANGECGAGLQCFCPGDYVVVDGRAGCDVPSMCARPCNLESSNPCPGANQTCTPPESGVGDASCLPARVEESCTCEDQNPESTLIGTIDSVSLSSTCDSEGAQQRWAICNQFTAIYPTDLTWPGLADAGVGDAGDGDAGVGDAGVNDVDAGIVDVDAGGILPADDGGVSDGG